MISLTESAAEAVRRTLQGQNLPTETFLRVRVKSGGCSGYSYSLTFEQTQEESDRTIEQHGIRLLVDPRSELYLAGSELDYQDGLEARGFVFKNPNASGSCGCGKSFSA
jgi:iron-sulfur cluster assembly protein